MKLKPVPQLKRVLVGTVLSLVASGIAVSADFGVTGEVNNVITITQTTPMKLGKLFAVSASTTAYKYMVLSPTGIYGAPAGSTLVKLSSIGTTQAAAVASVDAAAPFTVTMPGTFIATTALDGSSAGSLTTLGAAASSVYVNQPLANYPGFQLVNFLVGNLTNGTINALTCQPVTAGLATNTCVITPTTAGTPVTFGIGTTIVTDIRGPTNPTYVNDAGYTGTFVVTAAY